MGGRGGAMDSLRYGSGGDRDREYTPWKGQIHVHITYPGISFLFPEDRGEVAEVKGTPDGMFLQHQLLVPKPG